MVDGKNHEHDEHEKHAKEVISSFYESAIEAERETGRKEKTEDTAKRSLIVRIFSIFLGTTITIIGLIMLLAPGPGFLVIAAGLGILAIDVPFARRLLMIVKNRIPQDEEGKITPRAIVIMVALGILGISLSIASLWFTFFS